MRHAQIPVELYDKIETIAKQYDLKVDQYLEIYFLGVNSEKAEAYCEEAMVKHPNRIYKIATARSNNPGKTAIYYREK